MSTNLGSGWPHVVVRWTNGDFGAQISRHGDSSFVLWWHDGTSDEWEETFESEAVAMLRLACLVRCAETDALFVEQPHNFIEPAEEFLEVQVR